MANKKTIEVGIQFSADTNRAKSSLMELQNSMNNVFKTLSSTGNLPLNKDLTQAKDSAYALQAALQSAVNVNTGKFDLSKFQRSLKQSGVDLSNIRQDFVKMGEAGTKAYTDLTKAIVAAEIPSRTMNKHLNDMLKSLKDVARWKLSSGIVQGFQGALQTAYGYAQDLNKSLNDIRIVTGYSTEYMEDFAVGATKAAKALSTTTNEYTKASLIYFQQGLSDEEVARRTETTIKMANVTGEAASKVSSYMTAVWNNFDNGTKSLEYYADAITALGAATASSSEEIATGLQKFSAVASTVGLSYEYATAALATVTSETRESAETIGTAFKTIFARLESLSLGETLDDDTTMTKYSQALAQVGVNIKDSNGQLKDMDQIIDEVGSKWEQISKDQQIALAQTVAGMRQYNNFIALMDNYEGFKMNVDIAADAEGTLTEQQEIYAESWEAARDRVKAAAEDIFNKLLDDDFFIKLLNMGEKILGFLDSFIERIGGLQGLMAILSTVLLKTFSSKLADGIRGAGTYLEDLFGITQKKVIEYKKTAAHEFATQSLRKGGFQTEEESIAQDMMQKKLAMQIAYAENESSMTEQDKTRAQLQMQLLEIYEKQAIGLAKQNDALKKSVELTKTKLQDEMKSRQDYTAEYEGKNEQLQSEVAQALETALLSVDVSEIELQIENIVNARDIETDDFAKAQVTALNKGKEAILNYDDTNQADYIDNIVPQILQAQNERSEEIKQDLYDTSATESILQFAEKTEEATAIYSRVTEGLGEYLNQQDTATHKLKEIIDFLSGNLSLMETGMQEAVEGILQKNDGINLDVYESGNEDAELQELLAQRQSLQDDRDLTVGIDTVKEPDDRFRSLAESRAKIELGEGASEKAIKDRADKEEKRLRESGKQVKVIQDKEERKNQKAEYDKEIDEINKKISKKYAQMADEIEKKAGEALKEIAKIAPAKISEGAKKDDENRKAQLTEEIGQENIENYEEQISKIEEAAESERALVDVKLESNKVSEEGSEYPKPVKGDVLESFIELGSAISAGAAVCSTLSSLIDTLKSPDTSGWERVGAVFSTLLTLIPLVVIGYKALAKAIGDGNKITKESIRLKLQEIRAIIKSTVAKWAENAAWLASPITWIVVAIVAATAAVLGLAYAIFKMADGLSKAEKDLKEAEDHAKTMSEALAEAKDRADSLKDAFDQYESVKNTLADCVKGTKEWNEALAENNNKVLELMQQYPELAGMVNEAGDKAITRNAETGALEIADWAMEKAQQQADQAVLTAQTASFAANANVRQKKIDVQREELDNDLSLGRAERGVVKNAEDFAGKKEEEIVDLLKNNRSQYGIDGASDEKIEKWSKEIYENSDRMAKVNEAVRANTLATKVETDAIKQQIAANMKDVQDSDYKEQIMDTAVQSDEEAISKRALEIQKALTKEEHDNVTQASGKYNSFMNDELSVRYAEAVGKDIKLVDSRGNKNNREYLTDTGDWIKLSEITGTIAGYEANKEVEDELSTITQLYEKIGDQKTASAIAASVKGDTSKLSRAEIQAVVNGEYDLSSLKITSEEAEALDVGTGAKFIDVANATLAGYNNVEEYYAAQLQEQLKKQAEEAEKKFQSDTNALSSAVARTSVQDLVDATKTNEDLANLTDAQLIAYGKAVETISKTGGEEIAGNFNAMVSDLTSANEGQAEEIINLVNGIDWTNGEQAAYELQASLDQMGVDTSNLGENWEEFVKNLQEDKISVLKYNFEQIRADIAAIAKLSKDVKLGSIISDEDYKSLVKYNGALASMFQMTADGYRYIGEEDLSTHTDEIAEKTLEDTLEANARAKAGVNAASQQLEYTYAKEHGILDDDLNYIAGQAADENSSWAKTLDALDVDADYLTELAKQSQSTDASIKAAAEEKIKEFYDQVDQLEAEVASGKYDNKAAYEIYATSLNSLEELEAQKQRFVDAGQVGAYNKQLEYLQNYREQMLEDIDRYEDLNKQVSSLNQGLEDLQRLRDRSSGNNALDLLSQEISLTKELIAANEVALKQSESELAIEMGNVHSLGLQVDEQGNITNAAKIRAQYADDEDKLKEIDDTIKKYDELLDQTNNYRDAMKDAQDELYDLWDEYNSQLMETISLFDQLSNMDGFELGATISEEEYDRLIAYNEALADYYILTANGYKQIKEISQEDATKAWLDAGAAAIEEASQTITDAEAQLAEAEKASSFDKLTYYWSDGRDGNKNHTYDWKDLSLRDDFTGQAHAAMERIIGDEELLANVSELMGWDASQITHAFYSAESGNEASINAIKEIYAKIAEYQSTAGSVDDANVNVKQANEALKAAKESMIASASTQEQIDAIRNAEWFTSEDEDALNAQSEYINRLSDDYEKLISAMDDYETKLDSVTKNKQKYMVGSDSYLKALREEQEIYTNGINAATTERSVSYRDLREMTDEIGIEVERDDYGNIVNTEAIMEAAEKKYGSDSANLDKIEEAIDNYGEKNETLVDWQERQKESWVENSTAIKDWNDQIRDLETDYLDQALSKLSDKAFTSAEAISLIGVKVASLNESVRDTEDSMLALADSFGLETSGKSIDQLALDLIGSDNADAREKALELMDTYNSQMQEYQDLISQVSEQIMKHFEDISAQYDKMEDKISMFSDVIGSYRDIVDLVGKQNLGDGANDFLKSVGEQELVNAKQSLSLAKAEYERYAQERTSVEEKLASADTEAEKQEFKKALDEIVAMEDEAYANMNEQWTNALTVANEIFQQSVSTILEEMEKSVAGTFGTIDAMLDKYSQQSEISQRYLADYKQIYELSKLSRNLEKDIDNAQSVKSKQALKELQTEITELQASGTEMSAYDLENLQKRYDLRKAEIALEEAQEAKKTVRLQRDASGNWGYVYTQNADAVAQAEQTYEDKLYALQESSNKYLETTSQNLLKTQDEYFQAVEQITNDTNLSLEEKEVKINELTEFYNEKMKYQASEMQKIFDNNKTLYYEDWTSYSDATGYKIQASEQLATSFASSLIGQLTGAGSVESLVSNFMDMSGELGSKMGEAMSTWSEMVNGEDGIMTSMGTSLEEFTSAAGATVTEMSTAVGDFIDTLSSELPEETTFDQLLDSASTTASSLQTKYDEMLANYTTFINGMQEQGVSITARGYSIDGEGNLTYETPEGFDTGGYTGSWGDNGKLALLHEKELVLNSADTENILNAVDLVRTISKQIDIQAASAAYAIQLRAAQVQENSSRLEQEVTIHAEFPNATNRSEIEAAFDTLINRSAQYSNRN